jgi:hypothetical protein
MQVLKSILYGVHPISEENFLDLFKQYENHSHPIISSRFKPFTY